MSEQTAEKENTIKEDKFVDIDKAIAGKAPHIYKLLPRFILNYIKRTIHQEELNIAVTRESHRFGYEFVEAAIEEFGAIPKVIGAENIPRTGGVILAANHPLGGLDGIAFMYVVGQYRKDIKFFVNDLLMAFKNFAPIFVPVNKHGKNTIDYSKKFEEVYDSDNAILIFPAGLVSRKQHGDVIEDLVWKKSFIHKAVQSKKNVVPVFIDGHNSRFFYNLAYWRKKIGIKANIEMFYLADEMYKQRGKTLTFTFGEEISWQTFTEDKPAEYWSEKVKRHVYALQNGNKTAMLPTVKNKNEKD